MSRAIYKFTLDITKHESQVSLPVMLGDKARELFIGLRVGEAPWKLPSGGRAVFTAMKPDGNVIYNDCIVSQEGAVVYYRFTNQTANFAGVQDCQINLYDSDGSPIRSPRFEMVISNKVVYDDDVIESESERQALDTMIEELIQAKKDLENINLSVGKEDNLTYIIITDRNGIEHKVSFADISPRGNWTIATSYYYLDLVYNDGNGYVAIDYVPAGTSINDSNYWMKLVSKGEKGDIGNSGVYYGEDTPPSGYKVWIDPTGGAGEISAVSGAVSSPVVKGISHRGWRYAPQETIIAYQEAVDRGFKYCECDIRKTSDNEYVLIHDVNVASATAGASSATVRGSTLAQLKAMNFNYGMTSYGTVRVATLEEFLEFCRDNNVNAYLELKRDASLTEADIVNLIALTHKYGMENHVTWTSFSSELLGYVNTHDNRARIGYLCDFFDAETHGQKDKYYTDDVETLLSLRPNLNNAFICTNLVNLLNSSHTERENAKFELCLDSDIPIEVYVSVYPYNETVEAEWFSRAQTISSATPYRKMISGFILDYTDAEVKAKTELPWLVEEKKTIIFDDASNPLCPVIDGQAGNPTLQADFSKYKKLNVYYSMPAAQGVLTVNLENSGHISGIDVYSASAVCQGYDNARRLSMMTVTVNQSKTEFTVLRAGWMGFEFDDEPAPVPKYDGQLTPTEYRYSHWEARSTDYNVFKIEGVY